VGLVLAAEADLGLATAAATDPTKLRSTTRAFIRPIIRRIIRPGQTGRMDHADRTPRMALGSRSVGRTAVVARLLAGLVWLSPAEAAADDVDNLLAHSI
jgi:hypothetical protein